MSRFKQLFSLIIFLTLLCTFSSGKADTINKSPWNISLTGVGILSPTYKGSNKYHIWGFPNPSITWKDRIFFSFYRGLGINIFKNKKTTLTTSINYVFFGDDRSKNCSDLDDIKNYFLGTVLLNYAFFRWLKVGMSYNQAITKTKYGAYANGHINFLYRLTSNLGTSIGAKMTWANQNYLQSFYGINTEQAKNTNLLPYQPNSSGFESVAATVDFLYNITKKWSILTGFQTIRLVNSDVINNSPLIKNKMSYLGSVSITYQFI